MNDLCDELQNIDTEIKEYLNQFRDIFHVFEDLIL